MPFWQENRKFLLQVGAGVAVTLVGYSIVMGMYASASDQNTRNENRVNRIEILTENLGADEAVEMGRQEVLLGRWEEVKDQVVQTIRPGLVFADDQKGIRLLEKVVTEGDRWKARFEKRDMTVDESVRTFGNLGLGTQIEDVDEKIARLEVILRVMEAIDPTGISEVGGIQHEKSEQISIPDSEISIGVLPVRIEVEGPPHAVAGFLKSLSQPKRYVQLRKATLTRGRNDAIRAVLEVAALDIAGRETLRKDKDGPRGRRRPGRRRR